MKITKATVESNGSIYIKDNGYNFKILMPADLFESLTDNYIKDIS